jgi:SPP1 gp7 family putative phage head morphogenesis protein
VGKVNNKEFFTNNILKFAEELYKKGDKQLLILLKEQKANRDLILQEIANIMLKYNVVGDCMNLSLAEQTKLFKALRNKIDLVLEAEMDLEKSAIGTLLKDIGMDKYYSNSFLFSFGVNFKLKKITNKALNKIISEKISGKNYSDRIWDNKNNMAKLLKVEVKKFLNGETNLNNIEKAIKDKYNSNAFNTTRLAQTEVARVMEGVNDAWEKEHDIEYVMYCATLDSKTCTDCGKFDGQTFEISKKPIQLPKHPLCRCTYISLPNKDWKPKTRLDNISKKEVSWKAYEEWKKSI